MIGSYEIFHLQDSEETLLAEGSNKEDRISSIIISESPTASPTESLQPSASPRVQVQVQVNIENYPKEVTWHILDFAGRHITTRMQPGHYSEVGSFTTILDLKPSTVYTLVVKELKGRSDTNFELNIVTDDGKSIQQQYLSGDDQSRRGGQNFQRSFTFIS